MCLWDAMRCSADERNLQDINWKGSGEKKIIKNVCWQIIILCGTVKLWSSLKLICFSTFIFTINNGNRIRYKTVAVNVGR